MPSAEELTTAVGQVAASALQILIVAVLAYVALRIGRRFVTRLILRRVEQADDDPDARAISMAETRKRIETISALADWLLRLVIITFAIVALLVAFDLDSMVLLLAALVAGVAIVAQDVIRDYVGGAIIVMENQFGIGDWVEFAGTAGEVERVSLRRTVLRNIDGDEITVPNGEIRVAVNQTRVWARIGVDIVIAQPSQIDAARAVINEQGVVIAADPVYGGAFLEPPAFVRVTSVDIDGVRLLVRGRVRATERWRLANEVRRRLIAALLEQDIELVSGRRVTINDVVAGA
jgi:moderate conductance mechanosensitive channel